MRLSWHELLHVGRNGHAARASSRNNTNGIGRLTNRIHCRVVAVKELALAVR